MTRPLTITPPRPPNRLAPRTPHATLHFPASPTLHDPSPISASRIPRAIVHFLAPHLSATRPALSPISHPTSRKRVSR